MNKTCLFFDKDLFGELIDKVAHNAEYNYQIHCIAENLTPERVERAVVVGETFVGIERVKYQKLCSNSNI
jgi:hypothetical protein